MRKKKDIPVIENFEITGVAAEGKSLGRWNDLVVFVPYGAPGDVIDLKIDRKKHSYAEGHIERLVKPSELRVEPMCEHFGLCGGCKWQHLPYEYQLQCKQQQVVDAMERIAKVPIPAINPQRQPTTATSWNSRSRTSVGSRASSSTAAWSSLTAMRRVSTSPGPLTRCWTSSAAGCRTS